MKIPTFPGHRNAEPIGRYLGDGRILLFGQIPLPLDGWAPGPLFAPPNKKRAPTRPKGKEGVVHRAQTARATPRWINVRAVRDFYDLAAALTRVTGELYVVDHMVPKISPTVCGLHWEKNLQILHWLENARKSNSWWPDMWSPQGELF